MSKPVIITVSVVAVVIIGAGAFYLTQNKSNDGANSNTNSNTVNQQTAQAPSLKHKDACKVFTKETLAEVFGGTFKDGEEQPSTTTATPGTPDYDNKELRGSECSFSQVPADDSTAAMTQAYSVAIAINNHKDVASAKAFMGNLHSPQTAEGQDAVNKPIDIDDVGDRAFIPKLKTAGEEKSDVLYVLLGRQVITVTVTRLAGINHNAAQTALTNLGKKL